MQSRKGADWLLEGAASGESPNRTGGGCQGRFSRRWHRTVADGYGELHLKESGNREAGRLSFDGVLETDRC
jgi:hypothetical protein